MFKKLPELQLINIKNIIIIQPREKHLDMVKTSLDKHISSE
jgi:hypothetical protein